MGTARLVLCGVLGLLLLLPATAPAKVAPRGVPVRVEPARPSTTDTLTVTFRAVRLKPDERFEIGFGTYDNTSCTPGYTVRLLRQPVGRMVRVRLAPNPARAPGRVVDERRPANGFNTPSTTRFCAGGTELRLSAVDADGGVRELGQRRFGLAKDPAYPPLNDTPAAIALLQGSRVSVRRDGHPDRTLGLTGQLHGTVPGVIQLGRDVAIGQLGGELALPVIEPDAACAGPRYRSVFPVGRDAGLVLRQSGEAVMTLPLDGDPAALAGCTEPSAPGRTVLTLTGRAGDGGLSRLAVSGTLPGVTLAPGVTGDVTVDLLLSVDLSGRAAS